MTPEFWLQLTTLILTFIISVIGAVGGIYLKLLERGQKVAAVKVEEVRTEQKVATEKVEEVRTELKTNTAVTTTKLDEIHTQVNGAMSAQMRLTAKFARRVADGSGDPADVELADEAEKVLAEHEKVNAESKDQA